MRFVDQNCWFLWVRELKADGIDTNLVLRAAGHPSPFTYIIVDRSGASVG